MTNKEKAAKILAALADGFTVIARRTAGDVRLNAVGIYKGKCVGVSFSNNSGALYDVTNDVIYATRSEKICEATSDETAEQSVSDAVDASSCFVPTSTGLSFD